MKISAAFFSMTVNNAAHEMQPVAYKVLVSKGMYDFVPHISKSSPLDISPFHLPIYNSKNELTR